MNVFASTAPIYWAAGLPAIPLHSEQKRPAIAQWQHYCDRLPTPEEQEIWLGTYPDGNIGLPLGKASRLIAVDIDTTDPTALAVIDKVLPPSPWQRVGAKGMVKIYRFSGERTERLQTASGMIAELLSQGAQIVVPPSIHPTTQAPYTANADLTDILHSVPALPAGTVARLRNELIAAGIDVGRSTKANVSDFVPVGQRDNRMVSFAGILARAVVRGERTLLEALGEMDAWVEERVEKVVGDPLSADKARKKVVEFVLRDVRGARKHALPSGWDDGLSEEQIKQLGLNLTDEEEQWSGDRIIQQLAFDLQQLPDRQSPEWHKRIQETVARVARAGNNIDELEVERIIKFIHGQSGGLFTVASLRKSLKQLRKGDISGENHDEIADALREHIEQFGALKHAAGRFYQWGGSHWEPRTDASILNVISSEFGNLEVSRRNSDYEGILKLLKTKCAAPLRTVETAGVNFANGYLDEELNLLAHAPDYGATYVMPYRYMPELAGRMPMLLNYMATSWAHNADYAEKVDLFQEMMGATLFQVATKYQQAYLLFGQGGSGKSVASQLMRGLLPAEAVSSLPPQKWGEKFSIAELHGKVMNFAGELSETRSIPGDMFKLIVEGELIQAERKHQDPFNFHPTASQWFNSNVAPKTRDSSKGFSRRWSFLEWTRSVPERDKVPDLAKLMIAAEREAIAAWAVEGFRRLRDRGAYTEPASHVRLRRRMIHDINPVARFLDKADNLLIGRLAVIAAGRPSASVEGLLREYKLFTKELLPQLPRSEFEERLRDLEQEMDFEINEITDQVHGIALNF